MVWKDGLLVSLDEDVAEEEAKVGVGRKVSNVDDIRLEAVVEVLLWCISEY